jgi:hypothetical protein
VPVKPRTVPEFTRVTPAGKEPLIVNAVAARLDALIVFPEGIVAITALVVFHPAATARVRRFLSVPVVMLNEKALDLP